MSDAWHYRMFGQDFGPITRDELLALFDQGGIAAGDLVRNGPDGEWLPLGRVLTPDHVRRSGSRLTPGEEHCAPEGMNAPSGGYLTYGAASDTRSQAPPGNAPRDALRPPSAADELFLLVEDTEYGPISREQLIRMAAAGRLRVYQQVRIGRAGPWQPLTEAAADLGIESSAIRSPLPAVPAGDPTRRSESVTLDGEDLTRGSEWSTLTAEAIVSADTTSAAARRRISVIRARRAAAFAGSGLALVAAIIAGAAFLLRTTDRDYYDRIWPLYAEFQTLRDDTAAAAEWDRWLQSVKREQAELVPALDATAGSAPDKVARQHLLFAVRDYLPTLRQDSMPEPGRSEAEFQKHMAAALDHIEGRTAGDASASPGLPLIDVLLGATALIQLAVIAWLLRHLLWTPRRQATPDG